MKIFIDKWHQYTWWLKYHHDTDLVFPKVIPLNPEPKKTYIQIKKSVNSIKSMQKYINHCESLELAAILDAILDFEKLSKIKWIHQTYFAYVML